MVGDLGGLFSSHGAGEMLLGGVDLLVLDPLEKRLRPGDPVGFGKASTGGSRRVWDFDADAPVILRRTQVRYTGYGTVEERL